VVEAGETLQGEATCIRSRRRRATFSSTFGEVANSMVEISQPSCANTATFAVGGGGLPTTGPIATRSGPSWVSSTVSRCTVASGLR